MLRIEKVFLQGFKSFNDPTELAFDPEGITAVVGPNGCGKSNVADALSWVIGEQRAKALRGGKMEDVIFQGSRNRKPSGLAEVVLTLKVYESFELQSSEKSTNLSDQATMPTSEVPPPPPNPLNAEFSPTKTVTRAYREGDRITVGRRLYRTGESEYEMNGRICRLRDIQDLFAGTGLGGAHYAIIEQGRIGQVLSAKPLDRRALIEEAAGISKFKMRQRAAELKLEAAKQNLARVTDIISEVERQQQALKRQAAKSRRYQRLRQEMRDLMRRIYVADFQSTADAIRELESLKQHIYQEEQTLADQIKSNESSRQTVVAQSEKAEASLTEARDAAAQTNLRLEKARQQQVYLREQINAFRLQSTQVNNDHVAIGERERLTNHEIARLKNELKVIASEVDLEALSLSEAETIFLQQSAQDDQAEKALEVAQRRVTETATQRERWKQLLRQFSEAVDRAERTKTGLLLEQQRASEQVTKAEEEYEQVTQRLGQLSIEQTETVERKGNIFRSFQNKKIEVENLEAELNSLRQQAMASLQRYQSLRELDERRAYFSEPVQAIMQAVKQDTYSTRFNIIGTLADFIQVNSQYENLLEAGLQEELQYLIAPTFEDALGAISYLKNEHLGRATFLVLASTDLNKTVAGQAEVNPSIVRLIDLLGLRPDIRQVIQQALPRLAQTVIASELRQAIADSISTNGKGNSFLTPDGEFISAGHIISGGSSQGRGSGILALKREIEQLQSEISSQEKALLLLDHTRLQQKEELLSLSGQLSILEDHLREIEKNLATTEESRKQLEREKERSLTHLRVVNKEIEVAHVETMEVIDKLRHAQGELQIAEEAHTMAERIVLEAHETVSQTRRAASLRTQELSRRRADFAAKSERKKALAHDIKRLENELQDLHNRLSRAQFEAREADEQIQRLSGVDTQIGAEIEELQMNLQSQTEQIESLGAESTAIKNSLLRIESEVDQLRLNLNTQRDKRTETEIILARSVANLEHIEKSCLSDLGCTIAALLIEETEPKEPQLIALGADHTGSNEELEEEDSIPRTISSDSIDLEAAKLRLEELRQKVEAIGPINLLALEELGELDTRLSFLQTQKADIEQAVSDTLSVITELKRRSRDRFIEAFHEINRNFTEMFLELFGGGHGEMRLIDETDVLESGIDIIAQPPGKRLQNVLLLSGGEKAMAALALIMGIFKFRPSPFCLLDEVDAPLDDVNIGRFADKVLEMSQQTQFLVITHSKRTMEAAKTMYGVTMEDPGVSKLISVRLT